MYGCIYNRHLDFDGGISCVFAYKRQGQDQKNSENGIRNGQRNAWQYFVDCFLIGLVLTILPPQQIARFVEKQNVFLATFISAAFGTITIVPAFIAFPLVGTLVDAGVGIVPSVAFLTTLTMVGIVTFPLEKKEFGAKFTLTRNALSFVFAIIIALIMGVII